ncbi:MAG: Verru/Chthon cassette protein A, partial [Verrucomicrobiaceae bacterium]
YSNGSVVIPTFIQNRRRNIDMTKTLVAFEEKFKNNDLFRSASQICEINLVPPEVNPAAATIAATNTAMAVFWNSNQLTGDNLREKPYVDLYSRLTTKSNVYTVHFRVQVLKKSRSSDVAKWDETKDSVLSEHRGSSLIERYIDAADTTLPDFATDLTKSLDAYYKFRVLSTKKF